jgi:DNA adenine methylase
MQATPFLKWAGGKGQLLGQLLPLLPASYQRYIEPFLGGGALFFALAPARALLADLNHELITTYQVVRDQPTELADRLDEHRACHSKEYYYRVRAERPSDPLEVAARLIYLNKTCFNGLYRVNRSGQFNVPMGSYVNPRIYNRANLFAASRCLAVATFCAADYRATLDQASAGDFVYLDPPYVPLSASASFTSYTSTDFGEREQHALAEVYRELDRRGCYVMLNNSATPLTRQLYSGFEQRVIPAARIINSKGDRRGPVGELVVVNYTAPQIIEPDHQPYEQLPLILWT